jgi:AcrR family transcriptional regulator
VANPSPRRQDLTAATLGYVLRHGLIGLSLRPLAASLGTSDRMLIYHFGSKSGLIANVLELANRQLATSVGAALEVAEPPGTAREVADQAWRLMTSADSDAVSRVYLELCALSVREPQTWAVFHRQLREPWLSLLRRGLVGLPMPLSRATVLATLILDTIDGLILDLLITGESARVDAAAKAFGELLEDEHDSGPRRARKRR